MSKSVRGWLDTLTNTERKDKFGRPGEQNPNWRGGTTFCKCGARINSTSESCAACQDRTGDNNPFYGRTHSPKTKQKLSESARKRADEGFLPANIRRVCIDGTEYESVTEAARRFGVTPATIIYRIRSRSKRFSGYYYID